jgi:hypothetical protein
MFYDCDSGEFLSQNTTKCYLQRTDETDETGSFSQSAVHGHSVIREG